MGNEVNNACMHVCMVETSKREQQDRYSKFEYF
jgi:hypothetical protein